jgi:putative YphP/YqiW family bacilliredoxin
MYPEIMTVPMREELSRLGVCELKTAADVDRVMADRQGTAIVIVNSICGCAAGRMRPAVRIALQNAAKPDRMFTVFAGQDREATERVRTYFTGYPPSSPSIAIFRDGGLVHMIQRSDIEHRDSQDIASELKRVFDQHCAAIHISEARLS